MARMSKRNRPTLEGLEGRQLLNGKVEISPSTVGSGTVDGVPVAYRGISYVTPGGAKVQVQVLGNGSIQGTTVEPNGVLDLVYSGTNAATLLVINVRGGTAPLGSIRELDVPINNYTGIGGQLLGALLAPKMNLIDNGQVNMTSGIGLFQLHDIGRNTQIHLRELPETTASTSSSATVGTSTSGAVGSTGSATTTASATTTTSTVNPNPKPLPAGEVAVNQAGSYEAFAPSTYSSQGRTLSYSNDENGGSTLTGVSGQFTAGLNQVVYPGPIPPTPVPPPPGVVVEVNTVTAGTPGHGTIGDGQIFGYDPVANALIRFDAVTGVQLQTIPVGGTATTAAGVGMGENGNELVVLLGRGTTVQAFDAVTGAAVGSFSVSSLASDGINAIDGIGYNSLSTIVMDYNGQLVPGSSDYGVAVAINVTASLASGSAVAIGSPYGTSQSLELAGGVNGVATSTSFYLPVAAHFDPFQVIPLDFQQGITTLTGAIPGQIVESARTALPSKPANTYISAGLYGSSRTSGVTKALGSVEQLLALDTGVVNGQNVLQLYTPGSIGSAGTTTLDDPNMLASLSTSFHPELEGSALLDVQGNLQLFRARTVSGLALNDNGNLNQVSIVSVSNSTIIGQPFSHLNVKHRQNLTVLTPNRAVGMRGGVVVLPNLKPIGPLALPN